MILTERKKRIILTKKVDDCKTETVKQATNDLLRPFSDQKITVICDNSQDFTDYIQVVQDLNANVYFTYPQAAWERETNGKFNGLTK